MILPCGYEKSSALPTMMWVATQAGGWVGPIITQNVDRLHHAAGSRQVLELHGTTHRFDTPQKTAL